MAEKSKNNIFIALAILLLFSFSCNQKCDEDTDDEIDDDVNDDTDGETNDDVDDDVNDDTEEIWEDPSSGLTWQVRTNEYFHWQEGIDYCENLNWGEFDDWRLPSISELRSLIRGCPNTELGGQCRVTDKCLDSTCWNSACLGCDHREGPTDGCYVPSGFACGFYYWSSTILPNYVVLTASVSFYNASISLNHTNYRGIVRCARGSLLEMKKRRP